MRGVGSRGGDRKQAHQEARAARTRAPAAADPGTRRRADWAATERTAAHAGTLASQRLAHLQRGRRLEVQLGRLHLDLRGGGGRIHVCCIVDWLFLSQDASSELGQLSNRTQVGLQRRQSPHLGRLELGQLHLLHLELAGVDLGRGKRGGEGKRRGEERRELAGSGGWRGAAAGRAEGGQAAARACGLSRGALPRASEGSMAALERPPTLKSPLISGSLGAWKLESFEVSGSGTLICRWMGQAGGGSWVERGGARWRRGSPGWGAGGLRRPALAPWCAGRRVGRAAAAPPHCPCRDRDQTETRVRSQPAHLEL